MSGATVEFVSVEIPSGTITVAFFSATQIDKPWEDDPFKLRTLKIIINNTYVCVCKINGFKTVEQYTIIKYCEKL